MLRIYQAVFALQIYIAQRSAIFYSIAVRILCIYYRKVDAIQILHYDYVLYSFKLLLITWIVRKSHVDDKLFLEFSDSRIYPWTHAVTRLIGGGAPLGNLFGIYSSSLGRCFSRNRRIIAGQGR